MKRAEINIPLNAGADREPNYLIHYGYGGYRISEVGDVNYGDGT